MEALLAGGLAFVLAMLPESPFTMILNSLAANSFMSKILAMVNWFIPIYSWIAILEVWLAAVAVYYIYQAILRWLNAIE